MVAKRHDLICIKIEDNRESDLPVVGLVGMEDLETKGTMTVDTLAVYESFKQKKFFKKETVKIFQEVVVSAINLNVGRFLYKKRLLIRFFKKRERWGCGSGYFRVQDAKSFRNIMKQIDKLEKMRLKLFSLQNTESRNGIYQRLCLLI